jgi:transposase
MASRRPYPSDASDEQWAFVSPYLALVREDAPQRTHDLREVPRNGLRWVARTGSPWRYMPHDLPPWEAVSHFQWSRRQDHRKPPRPRLLQARTDTGAGLASATAGHGAAGRRSTRCTTDVAPNTAAFAYRVDTSTFYGPRGAGWQSPRGSVLSPRLCLLTLLRRFIAFLRVICDNLAY